MSPKQPHQKYHEYQVLRELVKADQVWQIYHTISDASMCKIDATANKITQLHVALSYFKEFLN